MKNQPDAVGGNPTKPRQVPSGSSSRKGVEVQVLSSAPISLLFFNNLHERPGLGLFLRLFPKQITKQIYAVLRRFPPASFFAFGASEP